MNFTFHLKKLYLEDEGWGDQHILKGPKLCDFGFFGHFAVFLKKLWSLTRDLPPHRPSLPPLYCNQVPNNNVFLVFSKASTVGISFTSGKASWAIGIRLQAQTGELLSDWKEFVRQLLNLWAATGALYVILADGATSCYLHKYLNSYKIFFWGWSSNLTCVLIQVRLGVNKILSPMCGQTSRTCGAIEDRSNP